MREPRRLLEGEDEEEACDLLCVDAALDAALAECGKETQRLSALSIRLREGRYERLAERWARLAASLDAVRDLETARPTLRQPQPALKATDTWWTARSSKAVSCPFDAATANSARLHHLRVRAAAARPLLSPKARRVCVLGPIFSRFGVSGLCLFFFSFFFSFFFWNGQLRRSGGVSGRGERGDRARATRALGDRLPAPLRGRGLHARRQQLSLRAQIQTHARDGVSLNKFSFILESVVCETGVGLG